jgi:hypothetical protein
MHYSGYIALVTTLGDRQDVNGGRAEGSKKYTRHAWHLLHALTHCGDDGAVGDNAKIGEDSVVELVEKRLLNGLLGRFGKVTFNGEAETVLTRGLRNE